MALFWKKRTEPVTIVALPENETSKPSENAQHPNNQQTTDNEVAKAADASINSLKRELAIGQARSKRLSASELQQLQEQRQLAMIRLNHLQGELDKLAEGVRMHNAYIELSVLHQEIQDKLYEQNKIIASMQTDEQRLSRFENCEEAMPLYLTLSIADQSHQQYRAEMSKKKEQARKAQSEAEAAKSAMSAARAVFNESSIILAQREEALHTGFRLDGQREAMTAEISALKSIKSSINETLNQYKALLTDSKMQLQYTEEQIAALQKKFTPLDSNRAAKEKVDSILVYLDNMFDLRQRKEQLLQNQKRMATRQRDLNDRLGALFMQDQKLEERINTYQAEISMHRETNHGIDGLALQSRVLTLRARKQELTAALKLWGQICNTWHNLEERRNNMRVLQQEYERSKETIQTLSIAVQSLATETEQKRYDYTVSKGQNVIRLRGDLREGVACTVCGAKTHPYHSDTIIEQNKLISEWKSDVDRLVMELENTRNSLLNEQLANASRQGTMATMSDEIEHLSAHMRELTTQWSECEALDRSLHGCNPASMSDSRTQTIRGLIETCLRDENAAIEQLNTFNYHQQSINNIVINIDDADNERAELHTALSETNTGCQVIANQIELMRSEAKSIEDEYQNIYKGLDNLIDISDWHKSWLLSHDNFKTKLRNDASLWRNLSTEIAQNNALKEHIKERIKNYGLTIADMEASLNKIETRLSELYDQEKQAQNLYSRLFGEQTTMSTFIATQEATNQALAAWEDSIKNAFRAVEASSRLCGVSEEAVQVESDMSDIAGNARSALDDWLYRFRLEGNPPCRVDELSELFSTTNNWKALRQRIREARRQYDITALHETELRSKILAAQQGSSTQNSASHRESLIKQRHEILMSIAKLDQKLSDHEKALRQLEMLE